MGVGYLIFQKKFIVHFEPVYFCLKPLIGQRLALVATLKLVKVLGFLLIFCQLPILNLNTFFEHLRGPLMVLQFVLHINFKLSARLLLKLLELVGDK